MPSIDCKNMPVEKAIRIFRRKCDNAGIKEECRERQHFEKPSAVKYEHRKATKRKRTRDLQKEQDLFATRKTFRTAPKKKSRRS
jgi:small subunit ribosomal protein S21|tara:strand:+ start:2668 stop:2919 length:252 start_codon:yes stop_codon:yes gene_type:complete